MSSQVRLVLVSHVAIKTVVDSLLFVHRCNVFQHPSGALQLFVANRAMVVGYFFGWRGSALFGLFGFLFDVGFFYFVVWWEKKNGVRYIFEYSFGRFKTFLTFWTFLDVIGRFWMLLDVFGRFWTFFDVFERFLTV